MKRETPIMLKSDEGKEIFYFLQSRLGLPNMFTEIVITLRLDDLIRVRMDYAPTMMKDDDK
jgi:hypothetical protein